MKKLIIILTIIFVILSAAGCSAQTGGPGTGVSSETQGSSASDVTGKPASDVQTVPDDTKEDLFMNKAVWAVYWDDEDVTKKLSKRGSDADVVCIFEAYFDDGYDLVYNDASSALFEKLKNDPAGKDRKYYLTFVNDVVGASATVQKDTEVLYSVLQDPAGHAADIVELAKKNGYDGVEIDYEKIRKDMDLWDLFIPFEKELLALCKKEGLEARVVLEPSTPVSKLEFPEGPEYVVMCYNLFGYGTKPGPKADEDFLSEIVSDFESLPGDTGYALSNGGFDWDLSEDSLTALTDSEGKALLSEHENDAHRDDKSGVMTFTYNKDGSDHEVWIADDETMKFWSGILHEKTGRKVNVSLWKL